MRCDVYRQQWTTIFKGVPTEPANGSVPPQAEPEAPATTMATFVVENGQPGAVQEGPTTAGARYEGEPAPFDPAKIN